MKQKLKIKLEDERIQHLITTDSTLSELIRVIGDIELEIEKDGYCCIVKYIIGQQISDKARETIWQRLCKLCGPVTPINFVEQSYEQLRGLGLSGRKIEYLRNFSSCLISKKFDLKEMKFLSNQEIIDKLILIKGIGHWTAEMYLIFGLGRLDVLSVNDGTIRRSIQWMYNLKYLPKRQDIIDCFKKWEGYETIVYLYLWKSISLGLQKIPFNNLYSAKGGILYETDS